MARKRVYSNILLDFLSKSNFHPSAKEIYDLLKPLYKKLSLATVYRNLDYLVKSGDIKKIMASDGSERFDGNMSPHGHFICLKCGSIIDFKLENNSTVLYEIEDGFVIKNRSVLAEGYCPVCSKKLGKSDDE
ncbi:transcriptional repressor [candidate division WOR-3 bacterium]|nr:transcriptional repressor [candidate division WOR-3 bacterium]